MDSISNIIETLGLHSNIYLHHSFCGTWSIQSGDHAEANFHLIGRGSCWLEFADRPGKIPLRAGDLVILRGEKPHRLEQESQDPNDEEVTTTLICGQFRLKESDRHWLLQSLPEHIVVRAEGITQNDSLFQLGRLIAAELEFQEAGTQAAVNRLADVLFIHVLRWLSQHNNLSPGILNALSDQRLGTALAAFHKNPAHPWTVDSLATAAALSRTGFSQRMQELAGMAPMQYVTQWRMRKAQKELETSQQPIALIAESVGYGSEAAFNRAFQKVLGITPARYRRQHRQQEQL